MQLHLLLQNHFFFIFCASNVFCVFLATEKVHAMEKESEIQSANEVKVRNVCTRIQLSLCSLNVYFNLM